MFLRNTKIAAILIFFVVGVNAQQPTPVVTGKSYSSLELERPATTARSFLRP